MLLQVPKGMGSGVMGRLFCMYLLVNGKNAKSLQNKCLVEPHKKKHEMLYKDHFMCIRHRGKITYLYIIAVIFIQN